jgi:uncharacterized protein
VKPLVFVDTGAWIALVVRDEPRNRQAQRFWERQLADGTHFVTTNYVVSETATWLRYRAGLASALAFRDRMGLAAERSLVRLSRVEESVDRDAWDLMEQYADLRLSFVDATSAVVARGSGITQVFGFDSDFRALGFDVQPAG